MTARDGALGSRTNSRDGTRPARDKTSRDRDGTDAPAEPHSRVAGVDLRQALEDACTRITWPDDASDRELSEFELALGAELLDESLSEEIPETARFAAAMVLGRLLRRREVARIGSYLGTPPRIAFRISGDGWLNLEAPPHPDDGAATFEADSLRQPPDPEHPRLAWCGGLIPAANVLVIEEVRVRARPGEWMGSISVALPARTDDPLSHAHVIGPVEARFVGRVLVRPTEEPFVSLAVTNAAAEVEIIGSLVDRRLARTIEARPLRLADDSRPVGVAPQTIVRVQLRTAADGTGATRKDAVLVLPGKAASNSWRLAPSPFWDGGTRLADDVPWVWMDGAGTLAPGLVWNVSRIRVRARSPDRLRPPVVVVSAGQSELARTPADPSRAVDAEWQGDVAVRTYGDALAIRVPAGVEAQLEISGSVSKEASKDR